MKKIRKAQWNHWIDRAVIRALDSYVDGIHYRSRAQLAEIILRDWIAEKKRGEK